MRSVLAASVLLPLAALAQDPASIVRAPNEGPARVYLAPVRDVYEAAQSAAATAGLSVDAAGDGRHLTASLPPGLRKGSGIALTAGRKYHLTLEELGPLETRLTVQEDRTFKEEYGGLDYVAEIHRVVFDRLAEKKSPKRVPSELAGEGRLIRIADPAAGIIFKNLSVRPMLQPTAMVGQYFWDVTGPVPPNYSPQSERRFTVVEGKARFVVGTSKLEGGPGDTVIVPRGVRMTVEPLAKTARFVVLETPNSDPSKAVWVQKDPITSEWADPYGAGVDAGARHKERGPPRDEPRWDGRCGGGCSPGQKCCNTGREGSYACMNAPNGVCPPRM